MKKVKVLRFAVEFFALCAVIAIVCTFADLWAGLAALIFAATSAVFYLFYDFYSKFTLYSIHYYTRGGEYKTCEISAMDFDDARKRARMYHHDIDSIQHVIKLGVEL